MLLGCFSIQKQHIFFQLTYIFAKTVNIFDSCSFFKWRCILTCANIFQKIYIKFLKNCHKYFSNRIYFWEQQICFRLAYTFLNFIYIFHQHIFFKQNLCSLKFFYQIILLQLAHIFSNQKLLFFIRMYVFQSGILFSISWNIFGRSQIYFAKAINILFKE